MIRLLLLLWMILLPVQTWAHELRPGYLAIEETAPETFKVPALTASEPPRVTSPVTETVAPPT